MFLLLLTFRAMFLLLLLVRFRLILRLWPLLLGFNSGRRRGALTGPLLLGFNSRRRRGTLIGPLLFRFYPGRRRGTLLRLGRFLGAASALTVFTWLRSSVW